MTRRQINPEYSAQRRSAPPNPAVSRAIDALRSRANGKLPRLRVADQGCGQLRHFKLLASISKELVLVDTSLQLRRPHKDGSQLFTVEEYAKQASTALLKVRTLPAERFATSNLRLDAVFCIAVWDVVLPPTRQEMLDGAVRNLKRGGHLVLVIPRNDTSILSRCTPENEYYGGHRFSHHGVHTFYSNFKDLTPVIRSCSKAGLSLVVDLSKHKQVCLVFKH